MLPQTLWNTEKFFYERFRYSETKQIGRKILIPSPSFIRDIFRYPKLSKHWSVPLQSCSALRQKSLTENHETPSPFLFTKFFRTKIFLKHRRFPCKDFRPWDKNFSTENRDLSPQAKVFDSPNQWHTYGFLCEIIP